MGEKQTVTPEDVGVMLEALYAKGHAAMPAIVVGVIEARLEQIREYAKEAPPELSLLLDGYTFALGAVVATEKTWRAFVARKAIASLALHMTKDEKPT